ncbi:1,4-alpha-glucan branching protein GlgB [Suttonella sp. R2A3]|uniref:1,4-alpha-glucan branching protein GlgB n=1 Tax=Suttonella sp. R2A3 TaxID=2908648 RepID=UPI001F2B097D|nr:1,4-alpha-glucan branching protein GlgB [Suttonella sp. R2A3]UJF25027.1 1,4-alpha-glucan branching protein GlgB [Suttonella sp. R2A3]
MEADQWIMRTYYALDGTLVNASDEVIDALSAMLEGSHQGSFLTTLCVEADAAQTLEMPFATGASLELYDEYNTLCAELISSVHGEVALPALDAGYYTVRDHQAQQVRLVVAPRQVYQPPVLEQGAKLSGITLQLYSLRSAHNWGIGDCADLGEAIDHFAARGADFIGINPLHALFAANPKAASPYSPSSRYWLNPIYLDVDHEPAFLASSEAQDWWHSEQTQTQLAAVRASEWVDYQSVWQLKDQALHFAFAHFYEDTAFTAEREAFRAFCDQHGASLTQFACFQVLDEHFASTQGWLGWAPEYHMVNSEAVQAFSAAHSHEIDYHRWLQWRLDQRLCSLNEYAHEAGLRLGLYGDLAVGAARGSADVWVNRERYALDGSIGAPPDVFNPQGQNWQLSPLNPQVLLTQGCAAWIALLRANMRHYGVLRIDHVMALMRLWWVAFGEGAQHGAYVRYPLEVLLAILALESTRQRCLVIGEDLGVVPDELRSLLAQYGVYTYRVRYFSEDTQQFPARALTTLGTHDAAPFVGYTQGKDIDLLHDLDVIDATDKQALHAQRAQVLKMMRFSLSGYVTNAGAETLHDALLQDLARSPGQLLALQLENLFQLAMPCNIPGVAEAYPNWRLKMPAAISSLNDADLWHTVTKARQEKTMTALVSEEDRQNIDDVFVARLHNPFAWLGVHECDGRTLLRVVQPDAQAVQAVLADGKAYALELVDDRGLFVGELPYWSDEYTLRVLRDGQEQRVDDAYRYTSALSNYDLWLLAEGEHLRPYEQLGAHPMNHQGTAGVRFALWAPNAQRISVIGDFNQWDGRLHSMRFHPGSGIWDIFIPGVARGAKYKFELLDAENQVRLKADPYAFAAELRPDNASVVHGLPDKVCVSTVRQKANAREAPISIYEVHLGSWRRRLDNHYWLDYDRVADELIDYVVEMGFTHIELLPVAEFPFDGSWGYQATGLYAPTARFGDPDGLRRLIARAHEAGIGVLLDWVVGHFPTDEHGLRHFDGTPLYEYADPREGYHQDWNTLIYNFARHEVRNFLVGNALYWIERYGFDGLRVDAVASMIYRNYSREEGQWIANQYGGAENLEAIEFLRRSNAILARECPQAMIVAEESTSFPGVTQAVEHGGLGFTFKWNMGWMNDSLRYMRHDPVHRRYHHQLMSFAMMYQYSESFVLPLSHDEVVHGKGSLLARMPGDCWQQFANLRAYFAFMWGHPGKKLLFMGGEFAQGREWREDNSLDWFLLDEANGPWHRGVQRWVRDLNHVYRHHSAFFAGDDNEQGFTWRVVDDVGQSVFAFERLHAGERVLVVVNFTPVVRENYRIGVGAAGRYREMLNSDALEYGGSGVGNAGEVTTDALFAHGAEQSLNLTLPPLGALFLYHEG